jgi:hypothetical protein
LRADEISQNGGEFQALMGVSSISNQIVRQALEPSMSLGKQKEERVLCKDPF